MGLCAKKKKIRRTRWEDERKNGVTTRTSWQQWGSELSGFLFLSIDIVYFGFFFFLIPADFYFSAGIWYISRYDWYNQVRILAAAFFINFSPIMWPVESAYGSSGFSGWNPVRPVLLELMYTRFSILKNRISVRFDIFPIGPPIRSEF